MRDLAGKLEKVGFFSNFQGLRGTVEVSATNTPTLTTITPKTEGIRVITHWRNADIEWKIHQTGAFLQVTTKGGPKSKKWKRKNGAQLTGWYYGVKGRKTGLFGKISGSIRTSTRSEERRTCHQGRKL